MCIAGGFCLWKKSNKKPRYLQDSPFGQARKLFGADASQFVLPPLGYPCSAEVIALRLSDERQYTLTLQSLSTPSSTIFQFFFAASFDAAPSLALWPGDKIQYVRFRSGLSSVWESIFQVFSEALVIADFAARQREIVCQIVIRFVKRFGKYFLGIF